MHCTSMVHFDKKVIVEVRTGQDLCFVFPVTVSYSQGKCLEVKVVIIQFFRNLTPSRQRNEDEVMEDVDCTQEGKAKKSQKELSKDELNRKVHILLYFTISN